VAAFPRMALLQASCAPRLPRYFLVSCSSGWFRLVQAGQACASAAVRVCEKGIRSTQG